jgi:membrane-associated phospholipid phosphatase
MFTTRWNLKMLAALNISAIILLTSWLWQPTRTLWDALDNATFDLLNAPLAHNKYYSALAAIANMRPVDVGVGVVMLSILIKRDFILKAPQLRQAFFAFFVLLLLLLLVRFGFNEVLKTIDWKRASPSLVLPDAVRLTQLFPNWKAHLYLKDSSEQCFPGDHASVLLIWAMLCSAFAKHWKNLLVWGLCALFMLPRLIAGAHWASDDFVGGVFLALIAFSWGYFTPILELTSDWLNRKFSPVLIRVGKWPLFKHLNLLAQH